MAVAVAREALAVGADGLDGPGTVPKSRLGREMWNRRPRLFNSGVQGHLIIYIVQTGPRRVAVLTAGRQRDLAV